jgi:hypothetical protein
VSSCFSAVSEISVSDFEAIKTATAAGEHDVVMLLWREADRASQLMRTIVKTLAGRHRSTHFVEMLVDQRGVAIQNFPVAHCPTIMVYSKVLSLPLLTLLLFFRGVAPAPPIRWRPLVCIARTQLT